MGKYDSLRKSHAPRQGAHALTPGLNYMPTVCRSVLREDGLVAQNETSVQIAPPNDDDVWDCVLDGLDDEIEEPLPVPELKQETRVVSRKVIVPPIPSQAQTPQMPKASVIRAVQPKVQEPFDALAMLEAATIRSTPKKYG